MTLAFGSASVRLVSDAAEGFVGSAGSTARPSSDTRSAILNAAMSQFAEVGYDAAGIRQIAAQAGVDPALVIRYFGSKAALFDRSLEELGHAIDFDRARAGGASGIGIALARQVLLPTSEEGRLRVLLTLRAATSAATAASLAGATEREFIAPLARLLSGRRRRARALQVLAVLTGSATVRYLIEGDRLSAKDARELLARTAEMVQSLVDDEG